MKIIADACTLILLAKASVLGAATEFYDIQVPRHVMDEVIAGKKKASTDALLIERLHTEKKLSLVDPDEALVAKIASDFVMGKGEASCIAYSLKNRNCILATDNKQGRKAALVHDIPIIGCISITVSLTKNKNIHREKALHAFSILQKVGWYHPSLIEKAREDIQ